MMDFRSTDVITEKQAECRPRKQGGEPRHYILTDDAILGLSESTPFEEGETLVCYTEDGEPEGSFWGAALEVVKATAAEAARITSGQARALFAMRAFYLLGVQRGGEAYRNIVRGETDPVFCFLPFEPAPEWSQEFAESLEELPPDLFNRLTAMLGLSVPWAAEHTERGMEE